MDFHLKLNPRKMRNYKELKIWEMAHSITLEVYDLTKSFPKEELYGLVSQMRRSSASVPTNIVEGCSRDSEKDFKRFLVIAMGSLNELEYQLLLAKDLKYVEIKYYKAMNENVLSLKKMLNAFIQRVKERSSDLKPYTHDLKPKTQNS